MDNISKQLIQRRPSRTIQVAKRVGIIIEVTKPHLPFTEQEQPDIM